MSISEESKELAERILKEPYTGTNVDERAQRLAVLVLAKRLFEDALAQVESESIRKWATSDTNLPHWEAHMVRYVMSGKPDQTDISLTAAYIVATAIGLV